MIVLSASDYIAGISSTAAKVTCTIFGMELTGTTEVYKVLYQGQLPATATTIYTAPASNTAFIRTITVVNTDTVDRSFTLYRGGIADANKISASYLVSAGGAVVYEDGKGWSQTTVQASATLLNDIHSGYSEYDAISNPSTPAADKIRIFARKAAGRMIPKWMPPSGIDTFIQPALFGNNIVMWQPGTTSGVMLGSVGTAITAGAAVLPTLTNIYTSLRRSTFTAATGINLMNSYRSDAMFFRGGSVGGGFFFFCRFGLNVWTASNRLFIGLSVDTTALLTAEPSAKFNHLGFAVDSGDSAISFYHNDGSGTSVKESIAVQPALATNNGYDAFIFCKPNDSTVYFRLDNINNGTTLIDSFVSGSELPVATTMMTAVAAIGSGPTNATAAVAVLGLNRIYVESDY